jgi:hypothetical protein
MTSAAGPGEPEAERVAVLTVRCSVEPHDASTLRIRVTSWPTLDAEPRESLHGSVDDALRVIAGFLEDVASRPHPEPPAPPPPP